MLLVDILSHTDPSLLPRSPQSSATSWDNRHPPLFLQDKTHKGRTPIPTIAKKVKFLLPGARQIDDYANRAAYIYANEGLEGDEEELCFMASALERPIRSLTSLNRLNRNYPPVALQSILRVQKSLSTSTPGLYVNSTQPSSSKQLNIPIIITDLCPPNEENADTETVYYSDIFEEPLPGVFVPRPLSRLGTSQIDSSSDNSSEMFLTASCGRSDTSNLGDDFYQDATSHVGSEIQSTSCPKQDTYHSSNINTPGSNSNKECIPLRTAQENVFTISNFLYSDLASEGIDNPVMSPLSPDSVPKPHLYEFDNTACSQYEISASTVV